jgi:DNA-binding NtrC family response regulator
MKPSVIFVDDEAPIREAVRQWLERSGFAVQLCASAKECLTLLPEDFPGVVISDLRMPGMDGMALLEEVLARDPELPFLLVTAHGDVPQAVEAMRLGAYDFIEKPFTPERLLGSLRRALEKRQLTRENRQLRQQVEHKDELAGRLLGSSASMVQLRRQVLELAPARSWSPAACTTSGRARRVPSSRSIAPPSPSTCSRASCSATRAAPSPVPRASASARSSTPTAAPCFSTRSRACP